MVRKDPQALDDEVMEDSVTSDTDARIQSFIETLH